MSIDRGMDEEDVVYICVCVCVYIYTHTHTHTHSGILFSLNKRVKYAICSNMDGARDYHTKRSRSDRERPISYDITYLWTLKK